MTNRWSKQKGNTEYRYDPVGNLTNVNYPATADLAFEYDALNRVVKDARNGVVTNTYTYYVGGQLATEATPQWASSTLTLGYTSRLRTTLTLAQPTIGNWTQAYIWDNARRLDTLTGSSGTFDYDYIAAATSGSYASRLVNKLTVPTTSAGPNITNRWDTTGRLTETKLVNGGTTFNRHAYALNVAHQRTQQTRPDSTYVDYSYDDAGQVATALSYYSGGSPITTEQLGYGYDAAQNLTKRTNNATVTTYSVNSLNQVTGDGMLSFGYDGNGNRSSQSSGGASVTYTYDNENQLVEAETDTVYTPTGSRWKTVWAYDARGRVRVREDYSWYGPGSYFIRDRSARYLYDGMRVIQERNENNTPQVTYTRGLDLAGSWERAGGIGGLLARTAHSGANGVTLTTAFYHADGNGNVTYLLKLDQTAGATYQFDPYGRLLASSGTLAAANTYRFSSKEVMLASGFYSFGYRFYDPATQRWLNRDPMGEEGGVNLYGYVENDPINGIDPLGLSSIQAQVLVAIAKGDLVALESLLATGMLSPAAAARVQEAINRLNSPAVQSGLDKACKVSKETTTVIGRVKDLQKLGPGEKSLLDRLRDLGSPKLNWKQNSDVLRQEMNRGLPIRDASVGDTGGQFLNAERNLIRDRGWTFDGSYWNPPK